MSPEDASPDKIGQPYARARETRKRRTQARFLACYQECGRVLVASRWSKVARSEHYRWLHEDPSYRLRFEAADIRYTQTLKDEAVRRAHEGVQELVMYKGEPVRYQGQLVWKQIYSDNLLIKLLEAGDPDRFNRQKVAPFDEDFDYDKMTEGQVQALLKWLRVRIQVAESLRAQRQPAAAKTGASEFPAVFRGDGWPYKREKKRTH